MHGINSVKITIQFSRYLIRLRKRLTVEIRFPETARQFCLLQSMQAGLGAHTTSSYLTDAEGSFLLRGCTSSGVDLTIHTNLVLRLIMCVALLPPPHPHPTPQIASTHDA